MKKECRFAWQTSALVPIFKGKGDLRVKLLEHTIKIVEKVLERRILDSINVDTMLFGFMPGRGASNALFAVKRM